MEELLSLITGESPEKIKSDFDKLRAKSPSDRINDLRENLLKLEKTLTALKTQIKKLEMMQEIGNTVLEELAKEQLQKH